MKEIKLTGYHADWSRMGEHNAVALLVDASEFLRLWPDGVPQTIYRRPDKTTYPVPCELEDEYVRVVLTSTETAITGMASLELQWIDDGAFARSATYSGRINTALDPDGEPGTPPDPPGQSWLDQAIAVGAGVALDRHAVSGMLDEVETLTGEARDIAAAVSPINSQLADITQNIKVAGGYPDAVSGASTEVYPEPNTPMSVVTVGSKIVNISGPNYIGKNIVLGRYIGGVLSTEAVYRSFGSWLLLPPGTYTIGRVGGAITFVRYCVGSTENAINGTTHTFTLASTSLVMFSWRKTDKSDWDFGNTTDAALIQVNAGSSLLGSHSAYTGTDHVFAASPITITPIIQADILNPQKNILYADTGDITVAYTKNLRREVQELKAAIAALA